MKQHLIVGAFICATLCGCGDEYTPTSPSPPAQEQQTGTTPPTTTTPGPGTTPSPVSYTIAGAGDIGMCGYEGANLTGKILDGISGTVFTTGDNAYMSANASEFANCYEPFWGRHKHRTMPTLGNHDVQPGNISFEYFQNLSGMNEGNTTPPNTGYYVYKLGNWRLYALNSTVSAQPGSAQLEWLRQDLAANSSKCSLAYWHHPVVSSGKNGDDPTMTYVWRLLYENGVDLVMNGHDHLYERFAPLDASLRIDNSRGIRQFIVGTGGAMLYDFKTPKTGSEVRIKAWGILKLTLNGEDYDWEFIITDSSVPRDVGRAACH